MKTFIATQYNVTVFNWSSDSDDDDLHLVLIKKT